MKIAMRLLSSLLILGTLPLPIYSELLIVKKTDNGFTALDSSDAYMNKDISEILLKYQWPMCITSELSSAEKNSLLSAGQPYAEELFIQKKLREKTKNNSLGVIFISTALYELFVTFYIFYNTNEKNAFRKALESLLLPNQRARKKWAINLGEIISSEDTPPYQIRQKINHMYNNANALFYDSDGEENPHSNINQACVDLLLTIYPELVQGHDTFALSDIIKNKSNELVAYFINELVGLYTKSRRSLFLPFAEPCDDCPIQMVNNLRYEQSNHIIEKTIALEYEARELNKGLLLRGTSFEEFQVGSVGGIPIKKNLAGSTLVKRETSYDRVKREEIVRSFEEAYKGKQNNPYSISLGNSLFAGALVDCTACAYTFLSGFRLSVLNESKSLFKTVGYGLLIDKKDYVQHSNSNLFFIAPLSSLASLLQKGEYFHSRVKAAVAVKNKDKTSVIGLFHSIKDSAGVILITRDPLKHAALFSQFLAENGRIIQTGDESLLTDAEKQFVEDLTAAQIDAAKYYKAVQVLTPKIQTAIDKWKKR